MKLNQFSELINVLPFLNQSFDVKRDNWKTEDQKELIDNVFRDKTKITLNRYDLFSSSWNTREFIIKTLMWGYPTKGRGNNINTLLREENFKKLEITLKDYIEKEITLEKFINDTESISGIGLSTMSKFAYFLKTKINGKSAIIFDQQIIDVIKAQKFDELINLKNINYSNSLKNYFNYLEVMNNLADKLKLQVDQLEYFIFIFGKGLSELEGEMCYDYK
jgi:hypothetical protein